MTVSLADLQPGDVVVTATRDLGGWFIRLRSRLMRQPAQHNHVAMFTHVDSEGIPRGLEGRPGGFGWCNMERYLAAPSSLSNALQPGRSETGRVAAVELGVQMVGMPYDWRAIMGLSMQLLGWHFVPDEWPEGGLPGQGVCSSALDALYEYLHWDNPGEWRATRGTDVDDWTTFVMRFQSVGG